MTSASELGETQRDGSSAGIEARFWGGALVAFVRHLPRLTDEDRRELGAPH